MNPKPVFDAVRRLLKRGFTPDEVAIIDAAFAASVQPDAPSAPESLHAPARMGPEGLSLLKQFEGCARRRSDGMVEAYPDPGTGGAPWTIGWGATGPGITKGTVWTQDQCDARLETDLVKFAAEVVQALGPAIARTSQAQFDALVSFHYNTGAIARATLTSKHRAGDFEGAAKEFGKWVNAAGRPMAGLIRRRAAEADLYREGSK